MRSPASARWSALHSRRLQWAELGWDAFVSSLRDPAVQELYRQRKQGLPIVITYGPSQVGKSSVLLQMLGLDPTSAESCLVERVLRGGRHRASSATASALRYRISPDNRWHLSFENQRLVTDDEEYKPTDFIRMMREQIGNRFDASDQPAQIGIPKKYVARPENCIAIDLPGLDSSDDAERRHVQAVMDRWFPVASTILIVLRASQISDLRRLEQKLQFRTQHTRYRLLLTHAMSADSERTFLLENRGLTLAAWRERVLPIIQSTIPDFPAKLAVFPFEVGDSRRNLPEDLRPFVEPLLAESEAAVRKNLDVTPESLLAQQAEYRFDVAARYELAAAERQRRIATLGQEIEHIELCIEQHRPLQTEARLRAEAAEKQKALWAKAKMKVVWKEFPAPPSKGDALFGWMWEQFMPWMNRRIEECFAEAYGDLPQDSWKVPQEICHMLQPFGENLTVDLRQEFGRVRGWWAGSQRRQSKYQMLTRRAIDELGAKIEKVAQADAQVRVADADARARTAKQASDLAAQVHTNHKQQLLALREQREAAIKDDKRLSEFEREELQQVEKFWHKLEEAWLRQDELLRGMFDGAHGRPLDRFYVALERSLRAVAWQRLRGAMT